MAHLLVMPRQGNTVESCVLVAWKVSEGAEVEADQPVCDVETDKATFEVPAGAAGVLLQRLRAAGDDVPVLEPIAVIGRAGEDWRAALAGMGAGAAPAPAAPPAVRPEPQATGPGAVGPAAGEPSGRPAAVVARPAVSPRARRLARAEAVEASALAGTGPGGRVIERDVRAALAAAPATATAPRRLAPPATGGEAPVTEASLKGVRKIIAERMRASLASTAQITLNGSAPAARISALRARFKASDPSAGLAGVTVGDLVAFAVTRVLPRFPQLNAHLLGTTVRTFERVHLGFAVDTPRGLLVPVIRDADQRSLAGLSAEAKRLAAACLGGTVKPEELGGATFTISNLGALGVESFTPVLNAPEVGILGVCAIVPRPVLGEGGAAAVELRMGLSLTVDHQVVDGAPAARALQAFAAAIADVDLLLAR